MNEKDVSIRIWTITSLPPEFDYVRKYVEKDGDDSCVTWIAHIPSEMLKDNIFSNFVWQPLESHAWNWLNNGSGSFVSLLGANAGNFLEHPNGDGYFLIGSSI